MYLRYILLEMIVFSCKSCFYAIMYKAHSINKSHKYENKVNNEILEKVSRFLLKSVFYIFS